MTQASRCSECAAELPPGSSEGLCPPCLLKLGFAAESETVAATHLPADASDPAAADELPERIGSYQILEVLVVVQDDLDVWCEELAHFPVGVLHEQESAAGRDLEGAEVHLPADRAVEAYLGAVEEAPVVLTVDVCGDLGTDAETVFAARVADIEPLGMHTTVALNLGGVQFLATASGEREFSDGAQVNVTIETDKLHFFDPETGRRLALT